MQHESESAARQAAHPAGAEALLQHYAAGSPLFIASPRHTLLAATAHRAVPHGAAPLQERAHEALRSAVADGLYHAVIAGALPFDITQPAALSIAPEMLRAGPWRPAPPTGRPRRALRLSEVPPGWEYAAGVAEAVRRIRAGEVDKVVLARTLELAGGRPAELPALLASLAARNPQGYTFAAALGGGRTLVGASPELLVSRSGGVLHANPLAGSVPRSSDPQEDQARARALLASRKDLHEHRLVVDAVAQALRPLCPQLQVPAQPTLMSTQTMWHLSTEITGRTEADALTLALALHPTPAVCGFPRRGAHELIRHIEPFDRAFYTGAFGWTDVRGDGEWVVAIRCAEVEEGAMRLYAGAGIVAESKPEAELAETAAKFRTMLDALGVEQQPAEQPAAAEALA